MGLISVNNKYFKKSNIVSNIADSLSGSDKINDGNEWNGDMHYRQVDASKDGGLMNQFEGLAKFQAATQASGFLVRNQTVSAITSGDGAASSTFYLDNILNKMLDSLAKNLRRTLDKYADMAIGIIADIIPEFVYYIRMTEFIKKLEGKGFKLSKAVADGSVSMKARGFYNFKLALNLSDPKELVVNDLDFDNDHRIYILTGANRGGKTTSTQGIGLLFALAQGGIYVPADSFEFAPADCIYTHFPADEDKTMDLGRLGEECVRFKEIFTESSSDSLVLMNETFSTTSFEEGYYIACDSIKALLTKKVRTIYNTHMHKLGIDCMEMSKDSDFKAASLIVKSEGGTRSFKLAVAPPEGSSYAADIAKKYGVTYEMLTGKPQE